MHARHLLLATLSCILLTACSNPETTQQEIPAIPEMKSITGTISYREKILLTPAATVTVVLQDISKADAPATLIAEQVINTPGQIPVPFEILYNPEVIDERMTYAVRATIYEGDQKRFVTDAAYSVLTNSNGNKTDLMLVAASGVAKPLFGTNWVLNSILGKAVNALPDGRKPHITFNEADLSVKGFNGCNGFSGAYKEVNGQPELDNLATTMMACADEMNTEMRFMQALEKSVSYKVISGQLRTYNSEQEELLIFNAEK
ncbi:MAG: YbaY family lipoprotein [Gammaproteobacteria bacterium]|nr:YbaY family lipoprotein [Gammaproteobacteria bacterium]